MKLFLPIHQQVKSDQKTIDYRPTDKRVFVTVGMLAGAETVYDINQTLRPHQPLLTPFGYQQGADPSVIQQTLNAATEAHVVELEQAIKPIWDQPNPFLLREPQPDEANPVTMDIDLSALPASKHTDPPRGMSRTRRINRPANWHGFFCPRPKSW